MENRDNFWKNIKEISIRYNRLPKELRELSGCSSIELDLDKLPDLEKAKKAFKQEYLSTKNISIKTYSQTFDKILDEIDMDEFNKITPDWDNTNMSLFIESLMLRLPTNFIIVEQLEEKLKLINGINQMHSLKKFMIDKTLRLTNLEYFKEADNKTSDEISNSLLRRIDDYFFNVCMISIGLSKEVKKSVIDRIISY